MTITALSDTHELHRELDRLPGGDLLIRCGDFSMFSRSWAAIEDFAEWLGQQPYRHKILTFGNHEFAFEADPIRKAVFAREGIVVLVNEGVEVDGLRVWASPMTPLYGAAFGLSSPQDRERHWAKVPDDTDVLVTHGPPHGILDQVPGSVEHMGDRQLMEAVKRVQPRLHLYGHIHGAYGVVEDEGTTFCNAALLGPGGDIGNEPLTFRLPRTR